MSNNRKYWFVPKKYGYGAQPSSIEGWLIIFIFILATLFIVNYISATRILFYFLMISLIITLIYISKVKTKGEWKWRWG